MGNVECHFDYDDDVYDIRYGWGKVRGFNVNKDESGGKTYYKTEVRFEDLNQTIYYDDQTTRTLLSHRHYDDLSEVMSVDWEKRVGRYGKVKIRGIIAIVQLKVYLNGKFLFEMENDKGEMEMVSVDEFKLLSKSKTHGLGL
jgi:hypothetical protein